jgi:DNA repair protein RecN (Recombination protein N)
LLENQKSYIKEKAFIQFQFDELNDFNLIENEEISLDENIQLLTQASGIISALATAQKGIIDNDQSILDQLTFIKNQLKPIIGAHQSIQELFSRIESSIIELKDIGLEAENIAEKIDNNPANLELLNDRLAKLQNLFRKHQVETSIDLIELKNSFENQLVVSQNIDDEISSVKKQLESSRLQVIQIGKEITQLRITASKKIAEEAKGILVNLAIPHAAIEFKIATNENTIGPDGIDHVDILFSANLGKSPQPLANVASGGEISRLNFTFRSLIAKNKNLPTLIYDEADTGISGDVASKMGSMMRQLGQFHQVISITHLPQVAAAGQNQWLVYKSISDNKTLSSVKKLNLEDRIQVLAQMLSGFNPSDSALSNARELISQY